MEKISWKIVRKNSVSDIPFIILNFLILVAIVFNVCYKEWYSVGSFAFMMVGYWFVYLLPRKYDVRLEKEFFFLNNKKYYFSDFKKFYFFIERNLPFFILVPKKINKSSIEIELPDNKQKIERIKKFLLEVGLKEEKKQERLITNFSRYFKQ